MPNSRRGLYRIRRAAGIPDEVMLEDVMNGDEISLPEPAYIIRGYRPLLDELPWEDEYRARARVSPAG